MTPDDELMAARLLSHGLSVPTVTSILEADFDEVVAVASSVGARLPDASLEDVQDAMAKLSAKLIEEMMIMLDESSPAVKARLLIGMFGKLVPIINTQKNDGPAEMRARMQQMFDEMRTGDELEGHEPVAAPPEDGAD